MNQIYATGREITDLSFFSAKFSLLQKKKHHINIQYPCETTTVKERNIDNKT